MSLRTAVAVAMVGCVALACTPDALRPFAPMPSQTGAAPTTGTIPCRVTRIIDGDTVDLSCAGAGAFRARLTGFDSPETFEPRCAAEAQAGRRATERLRSLVRGADAVQADLGEWDRHGRRLVRLSLDGRDVAATMIAEGHAVRYSGGRRVDWCARLA